MDEKELKSLRGTFGLPIKVIEFYEDKIENEYTNKQSRRYSKLYRLRYRLTLICLIFGSIIFGMYLDNISDIPVWVPILVIMPLSIHSIYYYISMIINNYQDRPTHSTNMLVALDIYKHYKEYHTNGSNNFPSYNLDINNTLIKPNIKQVYFSNPSNLSEYVETKVGRILLQEYQYFQRNITPLERNIIDHYTVNEIPFEVVRMMCEEANEVYLEGSKNVGFVSLRNIVEMYVRQILINDIKFDYRDIEDGMNGLSNLNEQLQKRLEYYDTSVMRIDASDGGTETELYETIDEFVDVTNKLTHGNKTHKDVDEEKIIRDFIYIIETLNQVCSSYPYMNIDNAQNIENNVCSHCGTISNSESD